MSSPGQFQPTEVELQMLRILWELGPSPVREIHARLNAAKGTNYSTTVKMLSVMLDKGLVRRDEKASPHVYRAVVTRESAGTRLVKDLVARVKRLFADASHDPPCTAIGIWPACLLLVVAMAAAAWTYAGVESDSYKPSSPASVVSLPGGIQKDDAGNVIFRRPGDYDQELDTADTPLVLYKREADTGNATTLRANLPSDAFIELAGVRAIADRSAWLPDGTQLAFPEDWPEVLRVQNDQATHGLIFRCQGISAEQGLVWDGSDEETRLTTPNFHEAPTTFSISGRFGERTQQAIRVGITDPWGPWQAADPDGALREQPPLNAAQRSAYDRLQQVLVLSDMVVLQGIAGDLEVDYEVIAVDKQGRRSPRRGVGIWQVGKIQAPFFDLKNIDLDHWEYRLREVRHWVTFENISLQPDVKTDAKAVIVSKENPVGANLPWRAYGRVVDADGRPLQGVTVRAATGVGTLRGGGSGVTDANGRYDFRFGMGIIFGDITDAVDGKPDPQTQYALVSARLDGHFEQNFSRHGNGVASLEPVSAEDAKKWGVEPDQVYLPNKPREVNFVMLPAAKVSGTLIGEDNQPLTDYSVSLIGEKLPPGSSVLAQVRTDENGRFKITEIPTTLPYQFIVRKPKSELKPPWSDSWAGPPMTFVEPSESDLSATFESNKPNGIAKAIIRDFKLQITGPGVHGKAAAALSQPIVTDDSIARHSIVASTLTATELVLQLSNEAMELTFRKSSAK